MRWWERRGIIPVVSFGSVVSFMDVSDCDGVSGLKM